MSKSQIDDSRANCRNLKNIIIVNSDTSKI